MNTSRRLITARDVSSGGVRLQTDSGSGALLVVTEASSKGEIVQEEENRAQGGRRVSRSVGEHQRKLVRMPRIELQKDGGWATLPSVAERWCKMRLKK